MTISHLLELFAVALKRGLELLILTLERCHLSLGVVLLLLALFELGLGVLDLSLDIRQEQVLIQRVYLTDVGSVCASVLIRGSSSWYSSPGQLR